MTATIVVTQNGSNVTDGGTVLTTQDVNLSWSGQCAGGNPNCSFAWTAPVTCGNNPTCLIPANTLTNGQQVALILTVTQSPTGDSATDSHSFTASTCSSPGSFSNSQPAAGATVQPGNVSFVWTLAQGTSPISYTVKNSLGTTLCGPTGGTSCTANLTSGGFAWHVEASNNCGNANSPTTSFTVSGSSCTSPGTASLLSPANAATVSAGNVVLSWSAVAGDSPITYSAKNTFGATLCSTTSTSCTINVSSGTITWFVQASNNCGTGGQSSSRSFTVSGGTSCTTLGTPSLVSPAPGATVTAGTVQLSWGAVSGTSPTYTVLYNNGLSQACAGTTANTCSITANSGTITWWVRASDFCGNQANSGQRSFTVGQPCDPPGAPVVSSPSDGAIINGSFVPFTWGAVAGTAPITYTVKSLPLGGTLCQTTSTSCSITATASGTFLYQVQAANACGAVSSANRSYTVNLCAATTVPVADFTIDPAQDSTVTVGGYAQKQPYVGQPVALHNTSARVR